MKNILAIAITYFCLVASCFGAYLENVPQTLLQPNGDTLRCFASGDEFHNWLHDADGYTIMRHPVTGYYVYADCVGGSLVPTSYVAGSVSPASVGLQPGANISAEEWLARRESRLDAFPAPAGRGLSRDGNTNRGHINNIVIFIRFSDDDEFNIDTTTVFSMFNAAESTTTSLYSYFKTVSYNQLEITSTFYPTQSAATIVSYQDIYPRSYYQPVSDANPNGYSQQSEREHPLLARAVNAISSQIPSDLVVDYNNDGYVDNVVFIVKGAPGGWNELLWPHQWYLYSPECYINGKRVYGYNLQLSDNPSYFNVSTLCHEMNHTLGSPDLYHYYNGTNLKAVGAWDLMHQNATPPQNMGAYMKYKYGNWIDSIPEITEKGTYSLYSVGSSAVKNCYKIQAPDEQSFYVLEYRNKNDRYDSSIPASGLLIYRIDTRYSGNSAYNGSTIWDEVYVYRPNGTTTSDGSIATAAFSANSGRTRFHLGSNPRPFMTDGQLDSLLYIHHITSAGEDSITFSYGNYLTVSSAVNLLSAPTGSTASVPVESDMTWTVTNDCEWLQVSPSSGSGSATLTLTALLENTSLISRTCSFVITASNGAEETVNVMQLGATPYVDITSSGETLSNSLNDSIVVSISSNANWSVTASCDWIAATPESGSCDGTVVLTATSQNSDCVERQCLVTISVANAGPRVLSVTQPASVSGELSVVAPEEPLAAEAGASCVFTVLSSSNWQISTDAPWIQFSDTTGVGDLSVTATAINENDSDAPRTAEIILFNSCGDTTSFAISQSASSALREYGLRASIYPNPATDQLSIVIDGRLPVYYQLLDVYGNLVGSGLLEEQENILKINQLSKGIYMLRLTSDTASTRSLKIVKM